MEKVTQLTEEQMRAVIAARIKGMESANIAEKAIKDAKIAELDYKLQLQQLYIEHKLNTDCSIDLNTGVVTWS